MAKSKNVTSEEWSYEDKVALVDSIIARIEAGELDLAEVFEQFATAVQYIKECDSFLQAKQEQVDILIETLKDESSE